MSRTHSCNIAFPHRLFFFRGSSISFESLSFYSKIVYQQMKFTITRFSNKIWRLDLEYDARIIIPVMVANSICLVQKYRQTSNKSGTLVGNKIVDHSDVVRASPVGAAPTTSSFQINRLTSMDWAKTTARRNENYFSLRIWCCLY